MIERKIWGAIQQLPIPNHQVRISAAHLVTEVMGPDVGQMQNIARLSNSEHKKGCRRFDALGGAIALTEFGRGYIMGRFEATDIKWDGHDKNWDARFIVPGSLMAREALAFLSNLSRFGGRFYESTPSRELLGELGTSELQGYKPVVPAEHSDWEYVRYEYLGVALQPPTEEQGDTSSNAEDIPSRRLFHHWRMIVTEEFYYTIIGSKQMAILSDLELATTKGGRQQGNMIDGTPLANNLGLHVVS